VVDCDLLRSLIHNPQRLTGITGAVAGAISMALGEYLATKSQAEVYSGMRLARFLRILQAYVNADL